MNRGVHRMRCVAKFCLHPSSSPGCAGVACSVETRKSPHSLGFKFKAKRLACVVVVVWVGVLCCVML